MTQTYSQSRLPYLGDSRPAEESLRMATAWPTQNAAPIIRSLVGVFMVIIQSWFRIGSRNGVLRLGELADPSGCYSAANLSTEPLNVRMYKRSSESTPKLETFPSEPSSFHTFGESTPAAGS